MKKYRRFPEAKPGELKIAYGKHEGELDLFYSHGGQGANKCDARLLSHLFENVDCHEGRNLREELIIRGYDITTMKFIIKQKAWGEK